LFETVIICVCIAMCPNNDVLWGGSLSSDGFAFVE